MQEWCSWRNSSFKRETSSAWTLCMLHAPHHGAGLLLTSLLFCVPPPGWRTSVWFSPSLPHLSFLAHDRDHRCSRSWPHLWGVPKVATASLLSPPWTQGTLSHGNEESTLNGRKHPHWLVGCQALSPALPMLPFMSWSRRVTALLALISISAMQDLTALFHLHRVCLQTCYTLSRYLQAFFFFFFLTS